MQALPTISRLHGQSAPAAQLAEPLIELQAGRGPGRRLGGGASAAGLPLTPAATLAQARTCRHWRRSCSPGAGPGLLAPVPRGSRALAWGGAVSCSVTRCGFHSIRQRQAGSPQRGTCEFLYDPGCGTGGFLAQSYEHIYRGLGDEATGDQLEALAQRTFYGREKENLIYPIALANLVLHGIDEPHLWHGNTLTGAPTYEGLFADAPVLYDVVLTNPPFGGKEGDEAQTRFAYKTSATQVLFLQHVIDSLRPGGRGGMVLDEGVLFRTNETAFVKTKMKLLDECDLWCIVSLPGGVFTAAGAGVKTNLLFFTKGQPTERVWYYDLSDVKVGKKSPLTLAHFAEFFALLPTRAESAHSWTVTREQINARNYDLKAVNPNARREQDTRTPEELLALIEEKGQEITEALASLRRHSPNDE